MRGRIRRHDGRAQQLFPYVIETPTTHDQASPNRPSHQFTDMSFVRYVRNIRRIGIRQWWHQLQYIGDAKAGTLVGTDQYVLLSRTILTGFDLSDRFGNKYFENLNPDDEIPGA
jgi:hypothetical protein